jgi:hypothetical protein
MSNLQISQYEIESSGNELSAKARTSNFCAVQSILQTGGRRRALSGSFLNPCRARKKTVSGFIYVSLVALTGCATSAELESLRAELAKANAIAARAEAGLSETQRELAAMKKASQPSEPVSKPRSPPATSSPKTSGYKWGKPQQD